MSIKWPLSPGSLQPEDFRRFAPLGYAAIADAYRFGYFDIPRLRKLLIEPDVAPSEPSELLMTFLNTAETFDRTRDVREELERLSAADTSRRPPLWMLLARLIIDEYTDPSEVAPMLRDVYEDLENPPEMKPFSMSWGQPPPPNSENSGATIIASLSDYLVQHGVV